MREEFTLSKAIEYCESLGFVVLPKERIKKLSFNIAETENETQYYKDTKEEFDRIREEDALHRIFEELKQSRLINKTTRKEPSFYKSAFDNSKEMTITTWALRVLE